MTTDHDTELLTIAEAAKLLKVSTITLHRWLKQGRLPAYHVGPRAVRIRRQDLQSVMRPTHRKEESPMTAALPVRTDLQLTPPTEEEVRRTLAALDAARALGERIGARRGDQPFEESWRIIQEAREERSQQP